METIRNKDGIVINRSRNLSGIRSYVSTHIVKTIAIDMLENTADPEAKLCILFENGDSFETNFASFFVLRDFVRRWRNTYGAKLLMNGNSCGTVSYNNKSLK